MELKPASRSFRSASTSTQTIASWNTLAAKVTIGLVALVILFSATLKFIHYGFTVQQLTHAGISEGLIFPIGCLELACLIIYLVPQTAVLGTFLLTGYLGGALLTNIIDRTDIFHVLAVGLLVWIGAYLRVAELRALVPLRKQ
jgi:hypothetical protein